MKLVKRATFGYPTPDEKDFFLTYEQFYLLHSRKKKDVEAFENKLLSTLEICWKDRVEDIAIYETNVMDEDFGRGWLIAVKLLDKWDDPLTIGPQANLPEAEEFRKFYGEKSQIRKFPNGSLCEAVLWSEGMTKDEDVLMKIAKECVKKHVGDIRITKRKLSLKNLITPIEEYDKITQAFDKVSAALYSLSDLPLTLSSVVCVSEHYRRTMSNPPLGRHLYQYAKRSKMFPDHIARTAFGFEDNNEECMPLPFYQPALKVLITMEHSPRFGNTFSIMNQFKTAFYIEIVRKLKEKNIFAIPTFEGVYVDINHITFLLEIGQEKEISMSKYLAEKNRFNEIPDGCDYKTLTYKIQYEPKLATQMYNLSARFSAFGPTCQLMKRFIGSHYLLTNLNPFFIELLVAEVFLRLDSTHGHPPRDEFSGFIHVLELISTHNFVQKPLFIDFSESFDDEKREQLEKHFINARPALPSIVIFTTDDETGIQITNNLEVVIVSRLIQLCKGALIIIKNYVECKIETGINSIMGNSIKNLDMDIIIHLNYKVIFHQKDYDDGKIKAEELKNEEKKKELPIVNFNVVEMFLNELKKSYSSIALFFYNPFGGNQIGVAFRPSFKSEKYEFKVNQSICRKMTEDVLVPNIEEFQETVMILGKGIVKKIEVVEK